MTFTYEQAVQLWDADVRIDAMFPLPQAEVSDELLSALEDQEHLPLGMEALAEHLTEDEREALHERYGSSCRDAWENLFGDMALRRISGVVVAVSTPVRRYYSETGCEYSWGHVHVAHLWVASGGDFAAAAANWAAERHHNDKRRAAA